MSTGPFGSTRVATAGISIVVSPSVSLSAYASGDLVGLNNPYRLLGAVRVQGGYIPGVPQTGAGPGPGTILGTGIIQSVVVADEAVQNAPLDLVFFRSLPSSTTFTDNAALDVDDADLKLIVGVVSILASDYVSFNDNSVATKAGIGLQVQSSGSGDLFLAVVSRGAPTYVAAGDLQITIGILQD